MSRKFSRQEEDVALLKLVGTVLEDTTEKPRRSRPSSSGRARRLWLKLRILLRRHPLVPATLLVCCVVWICVANVTRSSRGEAADAEAERARVDRGETRHAVSSPTAEVRKQGITEADRRTTRPLSYWFQRLGSPDWKTRSDAAFELVEKSRSSKLVLSILYVVLEDSHAGVRLWAVDRCRVLRMYPEKVRSAMRHFAGNEELLALYEKSSGRMRETFHSIIGSWLNDLDDDVRWTGLSVCWMLGSGASVFEPTLEAIAGNDVHRRYRRQARAILASLPGL